MTWWASALVSFAGFITAFGMASVVKTSIIVQRTMESVRALEARRPLTAWMCSWCSASPIDCRCNPRAAAARIGPRVWQCASCGEQWKHCECAS